MEKKESSIFYLGIAQGEIFSGGRRGRRSGLPIKALEKRLEYPGGYVKVSYAMFPEFAGRGFWTKTGRAWKPKVKQPILQRTLESVRKETVYSEILLAPELSVEEQEIPLELRAAYLHRYAPFERVCVSFSGEGGTFEAREAVLLLSPYLKRIRTVMFDGEECGASEMFADYLYYEYGIMPERVHKASKRNSQISGEMILLDFGGRAAAGKNTLPFLCSYRCINNAETLKFLDTTIKNGYNTES